MHPVWDYESLNNLIAIYGAEQCRWSLWQKDVIETTGRGWMDERLNLECCLARTRQEEHWHRTLVMLFFNCFWRLSMKTKALALSIYTVSLTKMSLFLPPATMWRIQRRLLANTTQIAIRSKCQWNLMLLRTDTMLCYSTWDLKTFSKE